MCRVVVSVTAGGVGLVQGVLFVGENASLGTIDFRTVRFLAGPVPT